VLVEELDDLFNGLHRQYHHAPRELGVISAVIQLAFRRSAGICLLLLVLEASYLVKKQLGIGGDIGVHLRLQLEDVVLWNLPVTASHFRN
jgi:hypothetical protein